MRKTSSAGMVSSNTRWIFRRELKVFMMLPVWLIGLRKLWGTCYLPLAQRIIRLWNTNGPLWLTQYLSEMSRIIVLWVNNSPYVRPTKGIRVRLTRSGLPVLLPSELRKIFHLLRGVDHAYALNVIRVTLTVLSVYRVIGCAPHLRIETITSPFTGSGATLLFWEVSQAVGMLPKLMVYGKVAWTYMSESAGPNFKKSTWSSGLDALSYVRDPHTWYHWFMIAWSQGAWDLIAWNLFTILVTLPAVPLLLMVGKYPKYLGRLAALIEARGKVRVVAITDWWTQVLLKPLHDEIFNILRTIPQDGTFDQLAPVHLLLAYVRASGTKVFSYDLSAATDRLPVAFQVQVLTSFGISWAHHWALLLTGRPWYLKDQPLHYAVGQPIGALSSWAMLALSHHILVQIAARRSGFSGWFPHYAILGDDIIIADASVAGAYLSLMESLGVPINLSKSFEMPTGGLEFAKRWVTPFMGDISPIAPKLILAALRNPRMMSTLIQDALNRDFVFPTRVVSELARFLSMIRPRKWMDRELKPILSSVFGPISGFWKTASGPLYKAVWIKLFPHLVANKMDELIDILYRLLADSQDSPLSEEESLSQLVTNFWLQVSKVRTDFGGLFWVPLLILSPAFWVYYTLACQAGDRLLEYQQKRFDYESSLWGREWMILEGLAHIVRGASLARMIKSAFDPGLLEWDRKVAEDDLRIHKRLFVEWKDRVKTIQMIKKSSALFAGSRRPIVIKRTRFVVTPTHLALVPLGFWGVSRRQKITLRPTEIPSAGRPIGG